MRHLRTANGPTGPGVRTGRAEAILTMLLLTPSQAGEESDTEVDEPCSIQILFDLGGGGKGMLAAGLLRSRTRPLERRRLQARVG